MSNYRRLISYIYAYEGGIKGKNIGFAKIETRGIQCKITVSVKRIYVGGNDIGVYLLAGEQEIYLGNIFIRGGSGEFRTVVSASDIEHSGVTVDQCFGLTIHDVKNTWRSYTTIWEDAVAHAAEVELNKASQSEPDADRPAISEEQIKKAVREIEEEFPLQSSEATEDKEESPTQTLTMDREETPLKTETVETEEVLDVSLSGVTGPTGARPPVPTGATGPTGTQPVMPGATGPTGARPSIPTGATGPTAARPSVSTGTTGPTAAQPSMPTGATGPTVAQPSVPTGTTGPTAAQPQVPTGTTGPTSARPATSPGMTGPVRGTNPQSVPTITGPMQITRPTPTGPVPITNPAMRGPIPGVRPATTGPTAPGSQVPGPTITGPTAGWDQGVPPFNTGPVPGSRTVTPGQVPGWWQTPMPSSTGPVPGVPQMNRPISSDPVPSATGPMSQEWKKPGQEEKADIQEKDHLNSETQEDESQENEIQENEIQENEIQENETQENEIHDKKTGQVSAEAVAARKLSEEEQPAAPGKTLLYRADAVVKEATETKMETPKLGNPDELERLRQNEDQEENPHTVVWEKLRREHTRILAFDYEDGCEILTIKPQDIGLLPRDTWVYGNNSFLLHGYYNYRYLILAKLFNPNGTPRYLLGVPGHYYSNERYMASMFGFPNFVLSKEQPVEDGRFGFWYTDIKLGG
ncbi:DUF6128 domain-containing protein [Lacrimispora sp.]|uniref:DUF6128 domain-containing protein n=1 Tax=Lacrimispora sp. TaxID=2719234 RepID=UPI0039929A62